jgi:hypothetical protein
MMEKEWIPTNEDLQWMRNLISSLKTGGIWGTSFAVFKKISDNEFELIDKNTSLPREYLEFEIEKVKIAFNNLGFKMVVR